MTRSRKELILLLSVLFVVSLILAGCGGDKKPDAQKKIALKLGHEMPENHPCHYGAKLFADKVSQKTNNAVTIRIFPNGTLGKQAKLAEGLAMGTVDLAISNTVVLEKYEPLLGVLVMPYVFRDWEHVYKVVDGPIGQELNERLESKGIRVLAYGEIGLTHINSIKPIESVADVNGLKLGVQPGPGCVEVGKALGTVAVATAHSEVYSALQLGNIDAQTQSASNMRANKHFELAKYFIINELGFFLEPVSMSKQVFDRLPPEHRQAILEAAKEAALEQRPYARNLQAEDLDYMVKNNGLIVTRGNIDEWRTKTEPVYQKFPQWTGLIARIRATK